MAHTRSELKKLPVISTAHHRMDAGIGPAGTALVTILAGAEGPIHYAPVQGMSRTVRQDGSYSAWEAVVDR